MCRIAIELFVYPIICAVTLTLALATAISNVPTPPIIVASLWLGVAISSATGFLKTLVKL